MSWNALAWAAKCRVSHAADKLILLALAERHNPESGTAYPSVGWLAEFSSLNRKTVIAALDRLEALGLIADSGQRMGKTLQVKAYSLSLETVPKAEQSQKRNSTGISPKQSQKRDTDTVKEPSEAKASSSVGKHQIPSDWVAPLISELPPRARACAEQWTDDCYQTEAEAFFLYWQSERKLKHDWRATWANRVIARHSAVMRDQKFGNAPGSPKPKFISATGHEYRGDIDSIIREAIRRGDTQTRWLAESHRSSAHA